MRHTLLLAIFFAIFQSCATSPESDAENVDVTELNLENPRFTKLLTQTWHIVAAQDTTGQVIPAPYSVRTQILVFQEDGTLVTADQSMKWTYDQNTRSLLIRDMGGNLSERQVISISEDSLVLKTPEGIIYFEPVEEEGH